METNEIALAKQLNNAWEYFETTKQAKPLIHALRKADAIWHLIVAKDEAKVFIDMLDFVGWDYRLNKPQDKWSRLRTWAKLDLVYEYADKQPVRGWSVWREMRKAIERDPEFARRQFESGAWGPQTTREELDFLSGNAPRHYRR